MKIVYRVVLVLGAMALVGCGGRPLAPGKEAAAGALFQVSRGAQGTQGGLAELLNAGAISQTEITASCPRGGSVTLRLVVSTGGTQTGVAYDATYSGCSYDGKTSVNGALRMNMEVVSSGTQVALELQLQGRVSFSGEISDFLDVNVTETVTAGDLGSPSASVTVTLDGTITNSSGTYTFTNEVIVIDGSGLQKAPEPGQG